MTAICIRVTNINDMTNKSNKTEGSNRRNRLIVRRSNGLTGGTGIWTKRPLRAIIGHIH